MLSTIPRYGLMSGALIVAYLLGLYFNDKKMLASGLWAYWVPFLIHAVMMWLATRAAQSAATEGTDDSFRARSRTPFGVFALANIIFWVALYALHLYDPELTRFELQAQLSALQTQATQAMEPQDRYELTQNIASLTRELATPGALKQPVGPYFLFLAIWNILGFALAALVTVLVRRG
jgi:Protein of unknown function (DUF4199)